MTVKVGDRIRLINMPMDPCPIEPGATGTVTWINEVTMIHPPFTQISVDWDNGRALGLAVPPDTFEVIE